MRYASHKRHLKARLAEPSRSVCTRIETTAGVLCDAISHEMFSDAFKKNPLAPQWCKGCGAVLDNATVFDVCTFRAVVTARDVVDDDTICVAEFLELLQ